jgi:hypothetical protein
LQRHNEALRYSTIQGRWEMDDVIDRVIISYEILNVRGARILKPRWVNISRSSHLRVTETLKNLLSVAWPICASFTKVPILGTRAAKVAFL